MDQILGDKYSVGSAAMAMLAQLLIPAPERKKPPLFRWDSSNVEVALR
jgi:hypothetical protein